MAKPETHRSRYNGGQSDDWTAWYGWGWNGRKVKRDKQGDLPAEVTEGRSQSPRSTAAAKSD